MSFPKVITELPYDNWVRYIFDHPVEDPQWYWRLDVDEVELEKDVLVDYTCRLFSDSREMLAEFTDAQINQGLWYLIGESTSDLYVLGGSDVSLEDRLKCIDAIPKLFAATLAERCENFLSNIDETGCGPLNSVCYMWWDIFPLCGVPSDKLRCQVDEQCLAAMDRVLASPSIACQESALHGLGHWHFYYPDKCEKIIDAYVSGNTNMRDELRRYATAARAGQVQ